MRHVLLLYILRCTLHKHIHVSLSYHKHSITMIDVSMYELEILQLVTRIIGRLEIFYLFLTTVSATS
jgi:hypothetical protein